MIEFIRKSRQEIKRESNSSAYADLMDGKRIIVIPYHANTNVRLHELAHHELNHVETECAWTRDYVREEIQANDWAYSKCDKTPSILNIFAVAQKALDMGNRVNRLYVIIDEELKKLGYIMTRQQKSWLWQGMREYAIKGNDMELEEPEAPFLVKEVRG